MLVRPHPALSDSWTSVDYSDLGQVAISQPASRNATRSCTTRCTMRTQPWAEPPARCWRRPCRPPVHTLVVRASMRAGRHDAFRYLVESFGGLAVTASSLDEHLRSWRRWSRGRRRVGAQPQVRRRVPAPHTASTARLPDAGDESNVSRRFARSRSARRWHRPLRGASRGPAAR